MTQTTNYAEPAAPVADLLARFPGETPATFAQLIGTPEVARLLDVHPITITRLLVNKAAAFPRPVMTLGIRPKWVRGDVLHWVVRQGGARVTGVGK